MKSLKESLFDKENVIDKPISIRDVYCLLAPPHGLKESGAPVSRMFSYNKLKKYKNPYYEELLPGIGPYLLGVITDLPVPLEKEYGKGNNCVWGRFAVTTLGKYINNSWKHEFYRDFEVSVYHSRLGKDMIEICLCLLDQQSGSSNGYILFTFKRK